MLIAVSRLWPLTWYHWRKHQRQHLVTLRKKSSSTNETRFPRSKKNDLCSRGRKYQQISAKSSRVFFSNMSFLFKKGAGKTLFEGQLEACRIFTLRSLGWSLRMIAGYGKRVPFWGEEANHPTAKLLKKTRNLHPWGTSQGFSKDPTPNAPKQGFPKRGFQKVYK